MTTFKGRVFFNVYDEVNGRCQYVESFDEVVCGELWVSDGTVEGTHLFKDLHPGPWPSGASFFFPSSAGHLYFGAVVPGTVWCQAWVTDGTPENTVPLTPDRRWNCGVDSRFTEAGPYVYFLNGFSDVYQTTGQPEGTRSVRQQLQWSDDRDIWDLHALGNRVLFEVYDSSAGSYELWAYDGANGTQIAELDGSIAFLGNLGGRAWYAGGSGELSGRRTLWSTDGTAAGTYSVLELPNAGGTVGPWATTARQLFYRSGGGQIFVTDGTPAGTRELMLQTEVARSSFLWDFLTFGDKVLFTEEESRQHYVSDGTEAGTIALGAAEFREPMFLRDGRVFYTGPGRELWTTDGTPAGTKRAAQALGVTSMGAEPPVYLDSGIAVFSGNDRESPYLVRRDATGAVQNLDLRGYMSKFAAAGTRAFFWHFDAELWQQRLMVTDGTNAGTKMLATVEPGHESAFAPLGSGAVFARRQEHGAPLELWTTDGTQEGTRALKTVPAPNSEVLVPLLEWRGLAFFGLGSEELLDEFGGAFWRSDGTADGTYPLAEVTFTHAVADGDTLTLIRQPLAYQSWEIWTTDGTAAGTLRRASGTGRLLAPPFRMPDGELSIAYLAEPNAIHIRGTRTNAVTIVDLGDIGAGQVALANGRLFFGGCRPSTGCELWATALDGSSRAAFATVRVEYQGTAETATGRAAVFRVSMTTTGSAHPAVIASTVDGTLRADRDYVPLTRELVFENDAPVTLTVPLRDPEARGSLSLVLSSPRNAFIERGVATAVFDTRRRAVRK
jgi:ELWxxDGT repeat protein